MILQKLLSNKNCKNTVCRSRRCLLSRWRWWGGRPSGRGERVQYAVLRVDDVHVLPAGAMVTVYSIVFTALFAIPSALFSSATSARIKRQRANRGSPCLSAHQQPEGLIIVMIVMMVVMAMGVVPIVNNASR